MHRQAPLPQAPESDAYAPDTPYRLRPSCAARHQDLRESTCTHKEEAEQQTCRGCEQQQRHCAELQQQHKADAAESARGMRTKITVLTQQLVEAQHEAAGLAADLSQSQRTCMHLQQQLILLQAKPSFEQQHVIIPLGEYLNCSGENLLGPEQTQAASLGSSDANSMASQDPRLVPQLGTAEHSSKTPAKHRSPEPVYRYGVKLHSSAASLAASEASSSSALGCHGPADVDSMLQALEEVTQRPCAQHTGLTQLSRPSPGPGAFAYAAPVRLLFWHAHMHSEDGGVFQGGCTCIHPPGDNVICLVGAVEVASSKITAEVHAQEPGSAELQAARVDIAAALKRRGELDAELAQLHAELAAARAELADVRACQRAPEVLKLRREVRRLRAVLPAKSGETRQASSPYHQPGHLADFMLT